MNSPEPRRYAFLGLITLVLFVLPLPAFPAPVKGHFEVYCDGVGIFLDKVEGAPAPGKLGLFSYLDFPPGTFGGRYIGQGKWRVAYVLPKGCVPDGKCEHIGIGKVWIDEWDADGTGDQPPKRISGKYEIDLNGKHLEGQFVAKESRRRHPVRVCM